MRILMTEKKGNAKKKELTLSRKKQPATTPKESEGEDPKSRLQETNKSQDTLNKSQKPSQSPFRNGKDCGKDGFYARVLDEAEKSDFETAARTEGLDEEIALMRIKIKTLLETNSDDIRLLISATNMLVKLVKTRYSMDKKQEKNLGEAIKNIIRDIGVPLGVAALNKKL
jgi:hypothetical protein